MQPHETIKKKTARTRPAPSIALAVIICMVATVLPSPAQARYRSQWDELPGIEGKTIAIVSGAVAGGLFAISYLHKRRQDARRVLVITTPTFTETPVGEATESEFLVVNPTSLAVTISEIRVNGKHFSGPENPEVVTIGPGERVAIPVSFHPAGRGKKKGSVQISTVNQNRRRAHYNVPLRAVGV